MQKDHAHLQEDFQLGGNSVGGALVEILGTVATLQEETPALLGFQVLKTYWY